MTNETAVRQRLPAVRALRFIAQEMWAILPETLELIRDIAAREHVPDWEAVLAKQGSPLTPGARAVQRGSVAVVPVRGPIFRYANVITDFSGATSIEDTAQEFQDALDNPSVRSIVLNIDSPGGMVNGASEFADHVAASPKPVIAYMGGQGASMAYWIGAGAGQIVVSSTAVVGSIGVISGARVVDDATVIEAVSKQSPRKRPDTKTPEGRAQLQAQLQANADAMAEVFVDFVARNRRVSREKVLTDFGQGDVLVGANAVAAGLADRVGTLEGVIRQLNGP